MSVYVSFDGSKPRFIASNSGWAEFCRWVTRGVRSGCLRHLVDWGWAEPARNCYDQLLQVMPSMAGDVRTTASLLQGQLQGMDDEVVTVNQGVKVDQSTTINANPEGCNQYKSCEEHDEALQKAFDRISGGKVLSGAALKKAYKQAKVEVGERPKMEKKAKLNLDDPHAVAEAVHEAGKRTKNWTGSAHDPSSKFEHQPLVADVHETMKEELGGATLEQFKAALLKAHRAGTIKLSRADLPYYAHDPVKAGPVSEIKHLTATFHKIDVPPSARRTDNAEDQPRDELGRFASMSAGEKVAHIKTMDAKSASKLLKDHKTSDIRALQLAAKAPTQTGSKSDLLKYTHPEGKATMIHSAADAVAPQRQGSSPRSPASPTVGSGVEHSKHVVEAVLKHGGDMVPMAKVRQHLAEKGVVEKKEQDAAINHVRGKHVTVTNIEGRQGITQEERDNALQGDIEGAKIGWLSLRR